MPTYDYSCCNCKKIKEVFHSIAELENPSTDTRKQATCCGKRMLRHFGADSLGSIVGMRTENNLKERRKRNSKHFKTQILPGITDTDVQIHHKKKLIKF